MKPTLKNIYKVITSNKLNDVNYSQLKLIEANMQNLFEYKIQMKITGEKLKEELDDAKLYPIVNNLDFQINKNLNHLSYRIRNMK